MNIWELLSKKLEESGFEPTFRKQMNDGTAPTDYGPNKVWHDLLTGERIPQKRVLSHFWGKGYDEKEDKVKF